jgi:hypothetical protein
LAHRNEFNQAAYIDNNLFPLSLQFNDTQIYESDMQSISVIPAFKVMCGLVDILKKNEEMSHMDINFDAEIMILHLSHPSMVDIEL